MEDFPGKASVILQVYKHRYCCPNSLYASTCTILLLLLLALTGVLDIGGSIVALATCTNGSFSSLSTANTVSSVSIYFLAVAWMLTATFCKISIGTGYELYRTIFFSVGRIIFTNLPVKCFQIGWRLVSS